MTKNEAISKIRFMLDVGGSDGFTSSDIEALNAAINALSECKKPKTNGDHIRAMADKELATFMIAQGIMVAMRVHGIPDDEARKATIEIMESGNSNDDISETIEWLRKEVSEDAGTD